MELKQIEATIHRRHRLRHRVRTDTDKNTNHLPVRFYLDYLGLFLDNRRRSVGRLVGRRREA